MGWSLVGATSRIARLSLFKLSVNWWPHIAHRNFRSITFCHFGFPSLIGNGGNFGHPQRLDRINGFLLSFSEVLSDSVYPVDGVNICSALMSA